VTSELGEAPSRLWQLARQHLDHWTTLQQDTLRVQRLLNERSDDAKRFFTGTAAEWDQLREQLYGREFVNHALAALLPADLVMADLGCGTGQMIERLAPYAGRVIGIDHTRAMLEAARRRLESFANVELIEGDLESIPIESNQIDAAIMSLALSYVAEPAGCVREMARVVRAGGRVVIVDVTTHDRADFRREMGQTRLGFSSDEMRELLGDAGLDRVRFTPLVPAPQTRGPALFLCHAVKPLVRTRAGSE
jgi:ArsR family transcriptional regulator